MFYPNQQKAVEDKFGDNGQLRVYQWLLFTEKMCKEAEGKTPNILCSCYRSSISPTSQFSNFSDIKGLKANKTLMLASFKKSLKQNHYIVSLKNKVVSFRLYAAPCIVKTKTEKWWRNSRMRRALSGSRCVLNMTSLRPGKLGDENELYCVVEWIRCLKGDN